MNHECVIVGMFLQTIHIGGMRGNRIWRHKNLKINGTDDSIQLKNVSDQT